jgi:eukaryotic-like serine/threonine-protein kinase
VVGELIAGRYELEKLVGSGGMSNVFRAHDRLLERTVALKILHQQYTRDDDYVERFRREARAVAQLAHPNIVTVIDRGEQDGRQFIVFEFVEGENLKEIVARGRVPVRDAVQLVLQVARALAFAHERGLVHRDVKPQNVLLNEDGQAKVTDFGIARSLDVQGVTQTGTVLGTSDYIAPEQARGQKVDPKTDIYSLGTVLYELLTGEVPFVGDNFVAVAMRHVNEPAPSVLEHRPDCPVRLGLAVERAMAKDPADRFESMGEFIAELEACLAEVDGRADEGATVIVPRARPRRRRAPRGRRAPGAATLLLVGPLAALVAVGGFLLLRDDRTPNVLPGSEHSSKPVRLLGIGAEDPAGDGEHDEEAGKATDRDPTSYWTTQDYRSFDKPGVGLVLDAGRPVALAKVTVTSDLGGFPGTIRASGSPVSGFTAVSSMKEVGSRTTFQIDTNGKDYRYYEVWLQLPNGGRAHINGVTART